MIFYVCMSLLKSCVLEFAQNPQPESKHVGGGVYDMLTSVRQSLHMFKYLLLCSNVQIQRHQPFIFCYFLYRILRPSHRPLRRCS